MVAEDRKMTYLNKTIRQISPFDIGKISGTTNPTFNTFNVDWLEVDANNNIICNDETFYSEAAFSPDSNPYGISRVHYEGNNTNLHLMGCNFPESSYIEVGTLVRGDDIAIHNGNSHYPKYQSELAIDTLQNIDRANLKIIRIIL